MACNVFGNPIENSTLNGMTEYKYTPIERKDRAKVALQMKNVGDKDCKALTFVENLKKQHGDGISTLCLIYNATGDNLTCSISKDWCGHIGHFPYPALIANGQWGAFLHVQKLGPIEGSVATVVYNGKNRYGEENGLLLAWSNNGCENKVFTESRPAEHYLDNVDWIPLIHDYVDKSGSYKSEKRGGWFSTISTGSGTSPIVEAIFTLDDAY
ncbi:unnamed protein product [Prunus armeniaca]|uniref:23 kDa jasmonate-induced protein-like n=1 Tax=Prunus armeniaca TaxID=36596 RepID=A0A6J5TZ98_PRUAR|nr:unnamed protein product [Prunus armeniaca]